MEEITPDLVPLVHGMYETMARAEGVGLAAPQVGVRKRLFTYDLHEGDGPGVVINPEIVETSGEIESDEGCLSVPGFRFAIVRADRVTMRGLDLDGREVVLEGDDLLARMIQHEIDHLDGVLLLDRLEPDVRRAALRELRTRQLDASRGRQRVGRLTPAARPCASSTSAAPPTRCRPSARCTTPDTRSRSSSPSPTGAAGAVARREPSPVRRRRMRSASRCAPRACARGDRRGLGQRRGARRGRRLRAAAARVAVHRGPARLREPPLLAPAALAGRRAGRAGDPGRRYRDRGVCDADRARARHRPRVRARRHPDRRVGDRGELRDRLVGLGTELLVGTVPQLGALVPEPQTGEPTHADKLTTEEFELDLAHPADELVRVVRAGNPRPGAWTTVDGHRLKVWRARVDDGAFVPVEVQPEGRARMAFDAFVRGAATARVGFGA